MSINEKTYISIPASNQLSKALSYERDNTVTVKADPENNSITEVLDKDIKRWARKLTKLAKNKVFWATICFGLGTTGLSIFIPEISKKTLFLSLTSLLIISCVILIIVSLVLWRHEMNVSDAAKEILDDLPKVNLTPHNEEKK